jgi:hypothetical protein
LIALLYLFTAVILLALVHSFVRPISRWAALVLLLLPLLFTGRAVLTGKVYAPVEMPWVTQPLADHRGHFGVRPVHNGALADIAYQMIPWREAVRRSIAARQWPLWNPYQACGDILAGGMQAAPFSPFTLVALFLPTALSFTFTGAITFFVAGLGAFVFARELLAGETASLFAASGWMFAAQLALTILWPLGFAWALFPIVMAATHRLVANPGRRAIGFLTAVLALEILAGHPETVLHVVTIAALYGVLQLLSSSRKLPTIGAAVVAGVLALLLTAIALLPFLDVMRYSGEYRVRALMYANEPLKTNREAVRLAVINDLFPFLRGGIDFPLERAEGGSVLLALGAAAVFVVRRKEVAFLAALLVVAFLAGTNSWPVAQLLHALPLFDSAFNDRLAVVVPFCLAILAALLFDAWRPRAIAGAMGVVAIIMTAAALRTSRPVDEVRAMAEIVPVALGAIVVLLADRRIAVPVVFALFLMQRTISDGALVPIHPPRIAYPQIDLFKPLQVPQALFRIAPEGGVFIPNTATMYGFEDVRGLTPMTFAPLSETYPLWLTHRPGFGHVFDLTRPMLSMMNVRYSMQDLSLPVPAGWRSVAVDIYTRLIENERVLARAFVPTRVRMGRTPRQELDEMAAETDFSRRAWIASAGQPAHERDNGPGTATATARGADLHFRVAMQNDGFVVISETAWPGWRAEVDGKRARLVGANHAFLAVYVTAGQHDLRLMYRPRSFAAGRAITFATAFLLALYLAVTKAPNFRFH